MLISAESVLHLIPYPYKLNQKLFRLQGDPPFSLLESWMTILGCPNPWYKKSYRVGTGYYPLELNLNMDTLFGRSCLDPLIRVLLETPTAPPKRKSRSNKPVEFQTKYGPIWKCGRYAPVSTEKPECKKTSALGPDLNVITKKTFRHAHRDTRLDVYVQEREDRLSMWSHLSKSGVRRRIEQSKEKGSIFRAYLATSFILKRSKNGWVLLRRQRSVRVNNAQQVEEGKNPTKDEVCSIQHTSVGHLESFIDKTTKPTQKNLLRFLKAFLKKQGYTWNPEWSFQYNMRSFMYPANKFHPQWTFENPFLPIGFRRLTQNQLFKRCRMGKRARRTLVELAPSDQYLFMAVHWCYRYWLDPDTIFNNWKFLSRAIQAVCPTSSPGRRYWTGLDRNTYNSPRAYVDYGISLFKMIPHQFKRWMKHYASNRMRFQNSELNDMFRMLLQLKTEDPDLPLQLNFATVEEAHDYLAEKVNAGNILRDKQTPLHITEDAKLIDGIEVVFQDRRYRFEIPKTRWDIRRYGQILSHCVGGYTPSDQMMILGVYEDDRLMWCVEYSRYQSTLRGIDVGQIEADGVPVGGSKANLIWISYTPWFIQQFRGHRNESIHKTHPPVGSFLQAVLTGIIQDKKPMSEILEAYHKVAVLAETY